MAVKRKPATITWRKALAMARNARAQEREDLKVYQSRVHPVIEAAQAARDTLDSLRRGAKFSPACYEAGYARLRTALVPFDNSEG